MKIIEKILPKVVQINSEKRVQVSKRILNEVLDAINLLSRIERISKDDSSTFTKLYNSESKVQSAYIKELGGYLVLKIDIDTEEILYAKIVQEPVL